MSLYNISFTVSCFTILSSIAYHYFDCFQKPGAKSSADLYLDKKELEGAFNDNTKAIIVNTPHNPTGKVRNMNSVVLQTQFDCQL